MPKENIKKLKGFTVRTQEETWAEFKMVAAHKRKSMNKYMEELIKREVERVKLKK